VVSEPARVTVSSPGDLLGLVPYLLGFRPSESLVVLLLRDGRVLLTARIDLPPVSAAVDVVDRFRRLAEQQSASGLLLFAYSADAVPARALLDAVIPGLEPAGLLDALHVSDSRWWSLLCRSGCCPAEGTPYDLQAHPMAAEAVYAGLTVAPDRTAVEARVSGPAAADHDRLEELARQTGQELVGMGRRERQLLMSSTVRDFVSAPRRLSEVECVRLALLCVDLSVRDVAWASMTRSEADDHVDLWEQVVAKTVAPWEAAPLCLLGMAAWISGNGALQNCCTDRARQIDPEYSLAELLDDINRRALPPTFWDAMAAEMGAAAGPLAG